MPEAGGRGLPPSLRRLARAALPRGLEPWARRVGKRRGWLPAGSPDDDPFQYPYWQILSRDSSIYPHYLWGTMCAAGLAAALGRPAVSVIEFGVAGGNGLLELERVAAWVQRRTGVTIEVIGFDSGAGLPRPRDHRDLPNLWDEGHYPMDVEALRARLRSARLVLGPVAETVPAFLASAPAPVGFVSFDLDLYSSTVDALAMFEAKHELLLPRVTCYFDDVIGFSHGDFSGERLAISEFNERHPMRKVSRLYGVRWLVRQDRAWVEQMYMTHLFEHPDYGMPDGTVPRHELPLLGGGEPRA